VQRILLRRKLGNSSLPIQPFNVHDQQGLLASFLHWTKQSTRTRGAGRLETHTLAPLPVGCWDLCQRNKLDQVVDRSTPCALSRRKDPCPTNNDKRVYLSPRYSSSWIMIMLTNAHILSLYNKLALIRYSRL
jgi:hypothetical protein